MADECSYFDGLSDSLNLKWESYRLKKLTKGVNYQLLY